MKFLLLAGCLLMLFPGLAIAQTDIELSSTESIDPVIAGSGAGNLTYVVTATNVSAVDATGVEVSSTLMWPAGVSVDSVTPSGTGTWSGTFPGTWTIGALAAGASETLTFVLTAGSNTAVGTDTISLSANLSAVAEEDSNAANDTTDQATSVAREVDIVMSKSDSPDPVVAGSGDNNLTYTVTATNNGPSDVTDLVISESLTLPAGVTLDSVTPSNGTWDGVAEEWTVSIPAGGSETLTVIIDVALTAEEGTDVISDTATVVSSGGGETLINTGDDSVTESTSIRWPEAEFAVSKEYSGGGEGGGPVEVTLTCTDTSGLLVYDPQVGTTPATLTVRRFDLTGAGTDCTVTEEVPDGFAEVARTAGCDVDPVADQSVNECTITNGQTQATFAVTKTYMDGNNVDDVTLAISCNTGLPIEQQITVGPGGPQEVGPGQYAVEFVVVSYDDGELTCTVSEEPAPGYSGSYDCVGNANTTCDVGGPSGIPNDEFFEGPCVFENVTADLESGAMMQCDIRNYPDPVGVVINKDWVLEGTNDGEGLDLRYELTLFCDGEIVGGQQIGGQELVEAPAGIPGCGLIKASQEGSQGFNPDWCKAFAGEGPGDAIHTAEVIPEFPASTCFVVENVFDDTVEVSNGCGTSFAVSAGQGASCTVTNTVFFEGIPTLSQYGMAIMALLMLGVGLVGFRRFA